MVYAINDHKDIAKRANLTEGRAQSVVDDRPRVLCGRDGGSSTQASRLTLADGGSCGTVTLCRTQLPVVCGRSHSDMAELFEYLWGKT